MALRTALRTPIPALLGLVKRVSRKSWVFALIAATFLLLSTGVGIAQTDGGGTQLVPPPPPTNPIDGVTPWGVGFGPGPASPCSATELASTCADKYQATFTTSGTQYGAMIAPPPSTQPGVSCTIGGTHQCSNGIQQANGVTDIVYDNYPSLCRFVDNHNTQGTALFVPQASSQEFLDFLNKAPSTVSFGYCALGVNYPAYPATASFPTGFYITEIGGPAEPTPPPPGAQQNVSVTLPTTRVPTGTNTLAPQPPQTVTFTYTRYDCWPGATPATPSACNPRAIAEIQSILFNVTPSPCTPGTPAALGTNCNGGWQAAPTVSCTVDGAYYGPAGSASCLADYSPPVVNGACSSPSVKDTCLTGTPVGESYDAATSTWTWTCDGEPGPPSTNSGLCSYVNAVNGVCNDALKDSCSAGNVNVASETSNPGPPATYTWICNGLGTGSPSGLCSTLAAANGVCGGTRYSCSPGSAVGESDNGTTSSWICDGIAGGTPSGPCSSADMVSGVCNDASQYSCAPGTPANETDNGTTSTWTCDGLGGGADSGLCSKPDPACAGGPVNGACNALRYSCAAGTPTSESDNGTTSTWTCAGSCGGSNDTICSSGDIINGACNNAVKYSCAEGTPTNEGHDAAASTWTWDCQGVNGGTTTSPSPACSSPDAIAGVCGGARYTCAPGTAVSEADNGTTSKWICDGLGGGANSGQCTSADPVNGACGGAADNCTSPAAPSGYIAAAGTWTCPGSNGGTSAPCTVPVNGTCGTSQYSCTAGTAVSENDDGTTSTWTCDGLNSGANSGQCSSIDPCAATPECQGVTAFPSCAGCVVGSMAGCTMGTGANGIPNGEMAWTCTNPNCTPVSCLESE